MLVFSSDEKLYLVEDQETTVIYEWEFGEPDEFKVFPNKVRCCVVILINKVFYVRIIDNTCRDWIKIESSSEEYPIGFIHIFDNCDGILFVLYPDMSMLKANICDNIPKIEEYIPSYLWTNGKEFNTHSIIFDRVYYDFRRSSIFAISPDKSVSYEIKPYDNFTAEIIARACNQHTTDVNCNTVLSDDGTLRIGHLEVAFDILKASYYTNRIITLDRDRNLKIYKDCVNTDLIAQEVSNFHVFGQRIYLTFDDRLMLWFESELKILFEADDIKLPITSRYDTTKFRSGNVKSARSY